MMLNLIRYLANWTRRCVCRAQAWSYITFSWHQTYVTMKRITALPTTFKYVVLEKGR